MGKKRRQPKPLVVASASPAIAAGSAWRDDWPALTGLRGIAALMVFSLHAWVLSDQPKLAEASTWYGAVLGWLALNGRSGVDIFFTLSGFLLSLPFAQRIANAMPHPSYRNYAIRRIVRIFPAYYLQLLLLLALPALGWLPTLLTADLRPGPFFCHLILWLGAWPPVTPWLGVWWTLPVEVGFYLLLPLLATRLAPGRRWTLVVLIIAVWIYRWALLHGLPLGPQRAQWVEHLPGRLDQFLIGMLAASLFVQWRERQYSLHWAIAELAVVGGAVAFILLPMLGWIYGDTFTGVASAHPLLLIWHSLASVCVAFVLLGLCAGAPWSNRVLTSRPMQWLGQISYGLYLWHTPVIVLLMLQRGDAPVPPADFLGFYCLALLFGLALAALSYYLLEQPLSRCVARRRAKMTASA
jgi:peptidoglycan/LPS O-acetylase OafA/YrhL